MLTNFPASRIMQLQGQRMKISYLEEVSMIPPLPNCMMQHKPHWQELRHSQKLVRTAPYVKLHLSLFVRTSAIKMNLALSLRKEI